MSRRTEAPPGMDCPYRHKCPHLDQLPAALALESYQEAFELRQQLHVLEQSCEQRIAELEATLRQRDEKIAQLQLQHRNRFKPNAKPQPPIPVKVKRRGAPRGHPGWHRREVDHIDAVIQVPAPSACPYCQCPDLLPEAEVHEHTQEDIVLVPRTRVTKFIHGQCWCPKCRRVVYQTGEGELPHCQIGPVTRAVAMHLRYDLQIPYRKVQHILSDLFGMPLVPASAMAFDRQATALGRPLYEELRAALKSSPVAYADETSWREDGQGAYLWFGGNDHLAVYLIGDRSGDSAVKLLGNEFDGTLVTDDYAAYNAVEATHRQTCWNHLRTRCKEIVQQIELLGPAQRKPLALAMCQKLRRFAVRCCALGRQMRRGRLSLGRAKAMIPTLQRQLKRIVGQPVDFEPAETLRDRVLVKDKDKLFTFLRIKGVEPTNNHAERSLRFLVILRKICFGTRSEAGSQSHGILPSLLQTAQRQGKKAIDLLFTLLTKPLPVVRAALFGGSP